MSADTNQSERPTGKQTEELLRQLDDVADDGDIHVSAEKLINLYCTAIDSTVPSDEHDPATFYKFADKVLQARCSLFGCKWEYDHCGLWQHKRCYSCCNVKYPEIPGSCSKIPEEIRKMTEEEYLESRKEPS